MVYSLFKTFRINEDNKDNETLISTVMPINVQNHNKELYNETNKI